MAKGIRYQVWVDGRKKDDLDSKQVALDKAAGYAPKAASVRVVTKDNGKYTRIAWWVAGEKK